MRKSSKRLLLVDVSIGNFTTVKLRLAKFVKRVLKTKSEFCRKKEVLKQTVQGV